MRQLIMKLALVAMLAFQVGATVPTVARADVVVTTCGVQTYAQGEGRSPTMDTTGNHCTAAVGATSGFVGQGSTTTGQSGPLVQGAVVTAPPTYVTGQTSPVSLQPIGGGLRIVPSVPDGNNTGTAPPSLMIGGWGTASGNTNAARMGPTGTFLTAPGDIYPWSPSTGARATIVTSTSGNVANASAAATLAATASLTNYVTGFECTGAGATAAAVVTTVLSGTISGSLSYTEVFPAGATVAMTPLIVTFNPPIPASAANTAIVITRTAGGAGNTNSVCNIHGYRF